MASPRSRSTTEHIRTVISTPAKAARLRADWTFDSGWHSPDGIHESEWRERGRPFPEDPDYADFWDAYIHYERLDCADPTP